jgi:hypothetical protein
MTNLDHDHAKRNAIIISLLSCCIGMIAKLIDHRIDIVGKQVYLSGLVGVTSKLLQQAIAKSRFEEPSLAV